MKNDKTTFPLHDSIPPIVQSQNIREYKFRRAARSIHALAPFQSFNRFAPFKTFKDTTLSVARFRSDQGNFLI